MSKTVGAWFKRNFTLEGIAAIFSILLVGAGILVTIGMRYSSLVSAIKIY